MPTRCVATLFWLPQGSKTPYCSVVSRWVRVVLMRSPSDETQRSHRSCIAAPIFGCGSQSPSGPPLTPGAGEHFSWKLTLKTPIFISDRLIKDQYLSPQDPSQQQSFDRSREPQGIRDVRI